MCRTDFEKTMERYPILQTRLAQIGHARVKRAAVPFDQDTSAANKPAVAAMGSPSSMPGNPGYGGGYGGAASGQGAAAGRTRPSTSEFFLVFRRFLLNFRLFVFMW